MCGRYTNHLSWTEIVELYDLTQDAPPLNLPARYNIAPTQEVPFIIQEAGERRLLMGRWWLVPHWAKEMPKYSLFNARSEDAHKKPSFRDAFRHRRCLIPANGFYEWTKAQDSGKNPHYIYLPRHEPFAFAGLWARNEMLGVTSCTILTAKSAPQIAHLHNRIPVVLNPDSYGVWLNPETGSTQAQATLSENRGTELTSHRVSRAVNSSGAEGAGLIEPVS